MRRSLPAIALLAAAILTAGVVLVVSSGGGSHGTSSGAVASSEGSNSASGLEGSLLPSGLRAHNFTLENQHGSRVSPGQYRGQVVILTFLSSRCGSPCILMAQQIHGALDELGHRVPVLAISTDPAADSPARTARFLGEVSLTGRIEYLTGSVAVLSRIWHAYGIARANNRAVKVSDSTAMVLLIDKRGYERISFPLEDLTPEGLAHAVRKLQTQP